MKHLRCAIFTFWVFILTWNVSPAQTSLSAHADSSTLNDSLIAFYPFNGNANDASGNGNNGTVLGATVASDRFNMVASAYYFDGAGNKIVIPSSLTPDTFSISFWTKKDPGDSLGQIILHGPHEVSITQGLLNVIICKINLGDNKQYQVNGGRLGGQWHHTVFSYAWKDGMRIYIDSVPVDSLLIPWPATIYGWMENSYIGYHLFEQHDFRGFIDDVRIYSRKLGKTEIDSLYHEAGWTLPTDTVIATSGPNGTIYPGGTVIVESGDDQVFSISPNPGYALDSVIADGMYVGSAASYTFTNVDTNRSIHAIFRKLPLEESLVAHYLFNGNANDESGNGNDGAVNGAVLIPDRFNAPASAYLFDGIDDNIFIPPFIPSDTLTISVWTKKVREDPLGQVIYNGTNELGMYEDVSNEIGFGIKLADGWHQVNGGHVGGQWHHTVVRYRRGDRLRIYVDSEPVDSTPILASQEYSHAPYNSFIGSHGTSSYYFRGSIDDIRIYSRELSQAEIDSLYHMGGWTAPEGRHIVATAGPNGTIDPVDTVRVDLGDDQAFSVVPDGGHVVDSVFVDGLFVDSTTGYTFENVMTNHTIHVTFRLLLFDESLVAYYPFHGNANDESGNGFHGTVRGVVPARDRFTRVDRAYSFNRHSYVDLGSSVFLNLLGGFTISAWMEDEGWFGNRFIVSRWDVSSGVEERSYALGLNDGNQPWFITSRDGTDPGIVGVVGSDPLEIEKWYHLTATFGDSLMRLYVDGTCVDSAHQTGINWSPDNRTAIGAIIGREEPYYGGGFLGKIDDVRIYNYVLTEDQIDSLYNDGDWPIGPRMIVATSGVGGTISPKDTTIVNYGSDLYLSITPNVGFRVDTVFVDGVAVCDQENYTFEGVTADHTIHAVFTHAGKLKSRAWISVSQNIFISVLYFGTRAGAEYGIWGVDSAAGEIDRLEGEKELPVPRDDLFDARFISPRGGSELFGEGSRFDFRNFLYEFQADTYKVKIHRIEPMGPAIIRWGSANIADNYVGPVTLELPGVQVDMKSIDSLVMDISDGDEFYIVTHNPNIYLLYVTGWNLLSLAVEPPTGIIDYLFPEASSSAFSFDVLSGYQGKAEVRAGVGYWLKFPRAIRHQGYTGSTRLIDTIEVTKGWNLIGALSWPISVSSIGSNPPSLVTSNFFGYSREYYTASSLEPRKGYWVKVSEAGELILSLVPESPSSRIIIKTTGERPPPPPDEVGEQVYTIPGNYFISQNFPNPFNPQTTFMYTLPRPGIVTLKIFNVLGQVVAVLVNEWKDAGIHTVEWDATGTASGVYFYHLVSGDFTETKKLVLMR